MYIENGQIAGLSEEEKETTLGGGLARFEAPEVADSEQMAAEFNAAAAKARRERHLSAVLNAGLYGRGNKEIDALVDEFADAKGLTAYDILKLTPQSQYGIITCSLILALASF